MSFKSFVGYVNQFNPGGNPLTSNSILNSFLQDFGSPWQVAEGIRQDPDERNALRFTITCPYLLHGKVNLTLRAFDWGIQKQPDGTRFHQTQIQAVFEDVGGYWSHLESEQVVAEAMQLLSGNPILEVWYKAAGHWACGRALFKCLDLPR